MNRFDRIVYSFLAVALLAACTIQCTVGSAVTPATEEGQCVETALSEGGE